jgi:hypothetical protein
MTERVAEAPQPGAEETLCVVCVDEPKQYAMLPCLHVCVEDAATSACALPSVLRAH